MHNVHDDHGRGNHDDQQCEQSKKPCGRALHDAANDIPDQFVQIHLRRPIGGATPDIADVMLDSSSRDTWTGCLWAGVRLHRTAARWRSVDRRPEGYVEAQAQRQQLDGYFRLSRSRLTAHRPITAATVPLTHSR